MSVSIQSNTNLASATTAEAVTKSDTTVYPVPSRAVYVGGAGDLTVHMAGNNAADYSLFASVAAGSTLPISVDMVLSTGTAAANVLLLR